MKVKVKIERSPYNPEYIAVRVQASQDGVPLRSILEALHGHRDQKAIEKALEQNTVRAEAKIGHYYHPLGNISKALYSKYLLTIESSKNESA